MYSPSQCYHGHMETAKLLLELGADPTIKARGGGQGAKGTSALEVARLNKHEDATLLMEAVMKVAEPRREKEGKTEFGRWQPIRLSVEEVKAAYGVIEERDRKLAKEAERKEKEDLERLQREAEEADRRALEATT